MSESRPDIDRITINEIPAHLQEGLQEGLLEYLGDIAAANGYTLRQTRRGPTRKITFLLPEFLHDYNPAVVAPVWDDTSNSLVPGITKDRLDAFAEAGELGTTNLSTRLWNGFNRLLERTNLAGPEDFVMDATTGQLTALRVERAEALFARLEAVNPETHERGKIGPGVLEFFQDVCAVMRRPAEPPTS